MACLFGHNWDGCKCEKCGKIRNKDHKYESIPGQCKNICSICGKTIDVEHDFTQQENKDLMNCKVCGLLRCVADKHRWEYGENIGDKKTCKRCGFIDKMYIEDSMGLDFFKEVIIDNPELATEEEAISLLGAIRSLNIMTMLFISNGYNLPFEEIWTGDYTDDSINKYIEGKVFDATSKEQALKMLNYQLSMFPKVKNSLENYPNISYLNVIDVLVPDEQAVAAKNEAPNLSAAQKLENGKEFFKKWYERRLPKQDENK